MGDGGEVRSTFDSTAGGVMCREVGAITGELEVSTRASEKGVEATIRYAGADEWYTVEGSPASLEVAESLGPDDLHGRVVEQLTTPGPVVDGNEQPVSLKGF
ncbi:MAG: hypothetical protein WA982_17840 [Rubrobacteraceae bacterium]